MVGKTVLIVDEDPASRVFLANYMRAKQFQILEAITGKEALIKAWSREPDLALFGPALTDIPDKEFIQKLCNDSHTSNVWLIALSNNLDPVYKEICNLARQMREAT